MSNIEGVSSIGIIMDGNRRWAKAKNLPTLNGHRAGSDTVRRIAKASSELGIKYLTLYAFSTENWKREPKEVEGIMNLLREFLDECISKIGEEDARLVFLGDKKRLDNDIIEKMEKLEEATKDASGLTLAVAINYGGRDEIIRTIKKLKDNNVELSNLTEEEFSKYLDTKEIDDPEIIIRTSGEMRTSNFLIWQSAYSEFFFVDKMWPDFQKEDLEDIIEKFKHRNRRFGGK